MRLVAALALPVLGDLARALLAVDHGQKVAGLGHSVQAQDLDRSGGAGLLDRLPAIVQQGAGPAPVGAGDDEVAHLQRPALDQNGRHHAAAAIELGLDDRAVRLAIGVGAHVEQFGLELHRLDQLVEVGVLGGADRDAQHVAAEILEHDVVAEQLLLDPIGVRSPACRSC